jgi:hypothetical protein
LISRTDIDAIRSTSLRLEHYAARVREKVWSGERDQLLRVLSDIAELGEVSNRLYDLVSFCLKKKDGQPLIRQRND